MRVNGTLYFVLKDHLGSASVVTDASGNIVGEQRYYLSPRRHLRCASTFGEARLATGTMYTDKLFTGQRQIAGLGIYHYQSRFYSPYLNQFIQPDTIVPDPYIPADWNKYTYVRDNPINFTDPTGKSPLPDSEYQACVSSAKLNKVAQGIKENVCGMISELEDKGYLTNIPDENHIPDNGGFRTTATAHRWSTAYHILHDFVSIEDLRKTPKDLDGTTWYKEEWDIYYCLYQNTFIDPQKRMMWIGYLDYLIKKNASDQAPEIQKSGRVRGYIYTPSGWVRDVNYALEGYPVGDPHRLPNASYPGVSKHVSGLAVDVSIGTRRDDVWQQLGYTEIDRIAHNHRLKRPLNTSDYVMYTEDEQAEWWHFEPFGR